ncbi:hypothetical protein TEQG_08577 [Trichophyton equinum CBS 127.97]|uniref:Uncharacterized protein n=1 Tax=Trichophyton equinum (strain ATCC MYA-4606 / CBS 127.97) TaxID=559882 RepID=F2PHV5_TRIEC|nr:hypothetical protein TEQG_08577 [Trichophyton equinum CBS 127.97]
MENPDASGQRDTPPPTPRPPTPVLPDLNYCGRSGLGRRFETRQANPGRTWLRDVMVMGERGRGVYEAAREDS